MSATFAPHLPRSNKCDICQNDIPFFESTKNRQDDLRICGSIECNNVLMQKKRLPDASFKIYLKSHKQILEQRKQRIAIKEQVKKQEADENQRILENVIKDLGDTYRDLKHRIVLPTGASHLTPLPQKRIEKYIAHLEKTIAEALSYDSVEDTPHDNNHDAHQKLIAKDKLFSKQPKLKTISDHFCMMCKGGCCSKGKEHAYISVSSIRRFLDTNPGYTADSLLNEYTSRIATESAVDACINQSATGCVLPRELRSSTCNQFHCGTVSKFLDKTPSDNDIKPVVVVQRKLSLWNRPYANESDNKVTAVAILSDHEMIKLDQYIPD